KLLPRCPDHALTYKIHTNLAISHLHLKDVKAGLASARKAQRLETPDFIAQRPFNAVILRRTHIRLLILAGRPVEAAPLVESILALGRAHPSPPIDIAVLLAHGSYDMAAGRHDVGLTRLRQALALARHHTAALSDALITVADAEAQAGNRDAAAVYTAQLADLIHAEAVQEAHQQLQMPAFFADAAEEAINDIHERVVQIAGHQRPPKDALGNLEIMAVTAAFKQDESGFHGIRVDALAYLLALEAGHDNPRALNIGYAARFHDLGLALLPPNLLAKSGPLTLGERQTMQTHTTLGENMLAANTTGVGQIARDIARYHHENWDGSGYPDAIAGTAIPNTARLCAVADVFDALMSPRPHRQTYTMTEALVILAQQAGKRLDPDLTRCFIESAQNGLIRRYLTGLSGHPPLSPLDDLLSKIIHR
ncbi:MAG: HD domain-containing protein, partial [Betaproteobacteria bacterium]|nr:HD domain-containing protein [Betaproteobacteria bacterium]